MNTLGLQAVTTLQPTLSPRLQRAVRLLQMSSLDFSLLVRQAANSNPFLETEDDEDDGGVVRTPPAWDADRASPPHDWGGLHAGQAAGAGGGEVFDTLAVPQRLAEHLSMQLRLLKLPPRERLLALALADSLDDDGYLRTPVEDIAPALGLAPAPDAQELRLALRRVQALDPPGVGARSLGECLALQLAQLPPTPACALASTLVRDHLKALGGQDLRVLARRVGRTVDEVAAACALVRRLDPRPGWRHAEVGAQYLTPDVLVRRQQGEWVAALNPAVLPRVRLNHGCAELFQRVRDTRHAELGAHLQEARWTLRNVAQRFDTILSVARAILRRQHRFLAYGAMAMKPLGLREIAQEVGVHESTVSRATHDKFMATPCGVYELRYFFSRGLVTASGARCSPTAIRGLVQSLVDAEPPGAPLSDVALARALAQQGLPVARRTVTKYRQQLRIAPAERRRPRRD